MFKDKNRFRGTSHSQYCYVQTRGLLCFDFVFNVILVDNYLFGWWVLYSFLRIAHLSLPRLCLRLCFW